MSTAESTTPPAPRPAPAPPRDAPPGKSPFPVILSIAFAAVIVASWIAQGSPKPPEAAPPAPAPAPTAKEGEPAPTTAAAPAPAPTPAAVTAEDLKGVKDEVAALAKKLDAMPKAEPAPAVDLKPIQEKLDGLARSAEATAALPKQVEDASGKLAESEKAIEALKSEVDSLKSEVASLKAKPAAAEPAKPAADAAAMTAAEALFKSGKYAEARDAFKKLPADDARVLYYTALANGFATNTWTGETEQAVLKGVDREKAGSPAKADIDAAFAGLTPAQGKAWLDSYRARAK